MNAKIKNEIWFVKFVFFWSWNVVKWFPGIQPIDRTNHKGNTQDASILGGL